MKLINLIIILMMLEGISGTNNSRAGRNVYFASNSIWNRASDGVTSGGYYVSIQVASQLVSGGYKALVNNYSVGGYLTQDLITDFPINIGLTIREGDIVVFFEIYNDLKRNGITPVSAEANVITYINLVKARGAKVIICTCIANHNVAIRADYDTDRLTINTWIRNNTATYGYTVCDLGAIAHLANQADADDTTYYADTTHPKQAGLDLMTTPVYNAITAIITN